MQHYYYYYYYYYYYITAGVVHAAAQLVVLHAEMSRVRFLMVSLEFFIDIKSFRSQYGPGVDSASNRNEYQEYFLGAKADGA